MKLKEIRSLFERELENLVEEVETYEDETKLWLTTKEVKNSAGNLAIHLVGNLQHFIGSVLGNSGYLRKRNEEFSTKNLPKSEILDLVNQTKEIVLKTLDNLEESELGKEFPIEVFGKMTTGFFLIHLYGHLTYHLGQINYHRRILA